MQGSLDLNSIQSLRVMAAPKPDSFARALDKFKQHLTPSQTAQFSISNLKDVKDVIRDIQQECGKKDRLCNMKRLAGFIEAMEQFGRVVQVFLNPNELLCFVWGPIKFLLITARTHLDALDKLLNAYDRIGNAIPGLINYQTTFEKYPILAGVLEDYYSDILRFHQEALVVFNRSNWKKFFHATWKTFNSKFDAILHSLEQRRELLESEKSSALLDSQQSLREDIEKVYNEQTRQAAEASLEKHRSRIARVKQRLQVPDYQTDQIISSDIRSQNGSVSGEWIFQDPKFLSWSDKTCHQHRVLYIHGLPGAGKTTLISYIIEKLLHEMKSTVNPTHNAVVYFYFKHEQIEKNNQSCFLRALLVQLLDWDAAISLQSYEDLYNTAEENLRLIRTLEAYITTLLKDYQTVFLVVDGLDECQKEETKITTQWLLSLVNESLRSKSTSLRILISGQRDGVLDNLLRKQPSISLDSSSQHLEDISYYCHSLIDRVKRDDQHIFNKMKPELEENIVSLVIKNAKGMFLYAKVVLENLRRQTTIRRLENEIHPSIFPVGLDSAYSRVTARVLEQVSQAEREDATKVLSIVLCAKRPLKWREIQAFFCIDPNDCKVDYDSNCLHGDCKQLCGSLIDIHQIGNHIRGPEDIVKIVHATAEQFLLSRQMINIGLESAKLSIFCTQYLNLQPFEIGNDSAHILSYAKSGYFSLQDYAVQYWFEHLRTCIRFSQTINSTFLGKCIDSARCFLDSYFLQEIRDQEFKLPSHSDIIKTIQSLPRDGRERNSQFNIELRTLHIRQKIAKLRDKALDSPTRELLRNLHGPIETYKCTKPWCCFFKGGINEFDKWKQHINHHELPFYCLWEGCFAAKLGFSSELAIKQHIKNHHTMKNKIHFPRIHMERSLTLFSAAEKGIVEAVKKAIDTGEDINRPLKGHNSHTPLSLAAQNGHFQVCELLLDEGSRLGSVDSKRPPTYSALGAAIGSGREHIVSLIINRRSPVEDTGWLTAFAARKGYLDIVRVLLNSRNFNYTDEEMKDVLLGAVKSGNKATVQYLLQNGFETQADENCLLEAIKTPDALPILQMLLSTGRPVIKSLLIVVKSLDESWHSLAKMLISYPKLMLSEFDLRLCLMRAEGKDGFDEIADSLRTMVSRSQSTDESDRFSHDMDNSDMNFMDMDSAVQRGDDLDDFDFDWDYQPFDSNRALQIWKTGKPGADQE